MSLSGSFFGSLSHTDKILVVKTHPIMLCRTCSIEGFPTLKTLDFSSKAVFHISKCLLFIMSSRYNQRSYSFSQAVSINRPTPTPAPPHLNTPAIEVLTEWCMCFMNPTSVFLFYTVCVTEWVCEECRHWSRSWQKDKTLSALITGYLHFSLSHTRTDKTTCRLHPCSPSIPEPPGQQHVAIKYARHMFGPSDGQIQMFSFVIVPLDTHWGPAQHQNAGKCNCFIYLGVFLHFLMSDLMGWW